MNPETQSPEESGTSLGDEFALDTPTGFVLLRSNLITVNDLVRSEGVKISVTATKDGKMA